MKQIPALDACEDEVVKWIEDDGVAVVDKLRYVVERWRGDWNRLAAVRALRDRWRANPDSYDVDYVDELSAVIE